MKAAKRKSLRKSDFVYPPGSRIGGSQGRYPIDTKKRARAALRYSARADTAGTYKTVSNKVYQALPQLEYVIAGPRRRRTIEGFDDPGRGPNSTTVGVASLSWRDGVLR